MRYLNLLTLLAGLGLGALTAATPGCGQDCSGVTDYVACTSTPGLRYAECPDTWEFNDGSHYSTLGRASDYCYCGSELIECKDGRMASLCNFTPLDGTTALVYDDNTGASLEKGTAACLGFDSCTLETSFCTYNGWYLRCVGAEGTRFVTSSGKVKTLESTAIAGCNPGGVKSGDSSDSSDPTTLTTANPPSYACVPRVSYCSELDDCAASDACYDASDFYYCADTVRCDVHTNEPGCTADLACQWGTI